MKNFLSENRTILSVIWLVFTVSLGVWWFRLALAHTDQLMELTQLLGAADQSTELDRYARQRRMILLEGVVFLFMLICGGVLLIWFVHRDTRRHQLIHDFFSTVTHEMKTPLTSLQLQIEALLDDNQGKPVQQRLEKLLTENARIELQMNKAFYLASLMRAERLYIEQVNLESLLAELNWDWPMLKYRVANNIYILADRRALDSILKNLFENSIQHGKSTLINVLVNIQNKKAIITVSDNGIGFSGDLQRLGKAFERHGSSSGTGIGVYIIKMLLKKMNGTVLLKNLPGNGFAARLELPLAINSNLTNASNDGQS